MRRGRPVTEDDGTITLMDADGRVRFVPSAAVRSRTLCPEAEQVPSSSVYVQERLGPRAGTVCGGQRAGVDGAKR
jgi:hypothetical protein